MIMTVAALAACERDVILSGQRFEPRLPLAQSEAAGEGQVVPEDLAQNRVMPVALGAASVNASWSHRGGNAAHAAPHVALSAAPQRVWSASIGTGNSRKNRVSAAPVVAQGLVFSMDSRAQVSAHSASTGGLVWQASAVPALEDPASMTGGGLAHDDGTLYVTTGFGELIALAATSGAVKWRQGFDSPISGAPVAAGGLVFVSGRDSTGWAVSARDGRQRWLLPGLPSSSGVLGGGSPAVGDKTVVFPFGSGQVLAASRATGDAVWTSAVAGQRRGRAVAYIDDIAGDPVIVGSTVYVGSASGRMAAFNVTTGERLWDAAEGAMSAPLVVGGSVFAVTDEGMLVRLDARDGSTIWTSPLGQFTRDTARRQRDVTPHFGPYLVGGRLMVASGSGAVRFFAADSGTQTGGITVPGGIAVPPAIAGGVMYVTGTNGQLHAFR